MYGLLCIFAVVNKQYMHYINNTYTQGQYDLSSVRIALVSKHLPTLASASHLVILKGRFTHVHAALTKHLCNRDIRAYYAHSI